jgi:hypothetical protein
MRQSNWCVTIALYVTSTRKRCGNAASRPLLARAIVVVTAAMRRVKDVRDRDERDRRACGAGMDAPRSAAGALCWWCSSRASRTVSRRSRPLGRRLVLGQQGRACAPASRAHTRSNREQQVNPATPSATFPAHEAGRRRRCIGRQALDTSRTAGVGGGAPAHGWPAQSPRVCHGQGRGGGAWCSVASGPSSS